MNTPIYLDHAASTRPSQPVIRAMVGAMEEGGNPSSKHALGQRARLRVEGAREVIAGALGVRPDEVVFTSGGTEANNLAVLGTMTHAQDAFGGPAEVVCSAVEHSSVWAACEAAVKRLSARWEVVPVEMNGTVRLDHLATRLSHRTALVNIMAVQNEVGTIQPLHEVARIVRQRAPNALLHVDAIQALGKVPCDMASLGDPDLVSVSAHKIRGPQGAGALIVRNRARARVEPYLVGGGQEGGMRCGTENVPAIAGFGAAVRAIADGLDQQVARLRYLRDRLLMRMSQILPQFTLNGPPVEGLRAPDNLHVSIPGLATEPFLAALSRAGVYASGGAACSAGKPSRVLTAMGVPWEGAAHLRLTVGAEMGSGEIDRAAEVIGGLARQMGVLA